MTRARVCGRARLCRGAQFWHRSATRARDAMTTADRYAVKPLLARLVHESASDATVLHASGTLMEIKVRDAGAVARRGGCSRTSDDARWWL